MLHVDGKPVIPSSTHAFGAKPGSSLSVVDTEGGARTGHNYDGHVDGDYETWKERGPCAHNMGAPVRGERER